MQLVKEAELIEMKSARNFGMPMRPFSRFVSAWGLNHLEEFALSVMSEMPFEIRIKGVMGG